MKNVTPLDMLRILPIIVVAVALLATRHLGILNIFAPTLIIMGCAIGLRAGAVATIGFSLLAPAEPSWNNPITPLHDYILSLVSAEKPSVLFLPTASGDDKDYIQAFYKCYTEDKCIPADLKLFYREELDLRSYILKHDIIHVGGGNTANMIAVWKIHGVDQILREAWEMGKVLCGGSAGAICWFEGGVTDSFGSSKLAPLMGCLGFIKGSVCPHYDVDKLRKPAYHEFLEEGLLPAGYAADNEVALHFEGTEFKTAVTSRPDGNAYKVSVENGVIKERRIEVSLL